MIITINFKLPKLIKSKLDKINQIIRFDTIILCVEVNFKKSFSLEHVF